MARVFMDWKRKILYISVVLASLNIYAENTYNCVVLETREGEMIEFRLSSNPKLIQRNDTVIMTNGKNKVELIMTEIKKIFFSSTNDDIIKIRGAAKGRIEVQDGCVYLSNFTPGEFIFIFNLSGQLILRRVITSQGTLVIPFTDIPKGIVIIKSINQFLKIKCQ
jgi:hypothetical protein